MTSLMRSTSRATLVALALAAPVVAPVTAIAQTSDQSVEQPAEDPAVPEEMAPAVEEGEPALMPDSETAEGGDMAADPMASDPMAADPMEGEASDMAEAEEPAKPVEGQITMQDQDTILADDLLGAAVYNGADEKVGDINDLIISLGGEVEGVVIGVGGFLGMGQKDVAVEMASLDVVRDDAGSPRLVTNATKADLESAPEFVTAEEQAREADALRMEEETTTGGSEAPIE